PGADHARDDSGIGRGGRRALEQLEQTLVGADVRLLHGLAETAHALLVRRQAVSEYSDPLAVAPEQVLSGEVTGAVMIGADRVMLRLVIKAVHVDARPPPLELPTQVAEGAVYRPGPLTA